MGWIQWNLKCTLLWLSKVTLQCNITRAYKGDEEWSANLSLSACSSASCLQTRHDAGGGNRKEPVTYTHSLCALAQN